MAALTTWQGFNILAEEMTLVASTYLVESYAWSSTCNPCLALLIAICDNATHITLK